MRSPLRASTLLLLALLLALFASTPVPLAVTVAVAAWALHTPLVLLCSVLTVLAYRAKHPVKRSA